MALSTAIESSGYIEARCKNCKSRIYRVGDQWVHNWGTPECAVRLYAEPDFNR